MQLGKAESIRVFDHEQRCIRNINADFDDRRGDEHADFTVAETAHDFVAFLSGHPSMKKTDAVVLERSASHLLRHLTGITNVVQLFRRFNQRIDDEHLTTSAELTKHSLVHSATVAVSEYFPGDRSPDRKSV